ncbi:ATP-binding protein [Actinomadura sp. DC4]|uniref:sensor histidine kinase n=1 Tax=Actinomadura sp. DC4 TaxID=3055069 RepID=UPI0025B1B4B6|nr:ATP-binding protein [Actinomadura sp. DC4]MDN3351072.1 ATP-binding protein [Actinomadura sp. DC4]
MIPRPLDRLRTIKIKLGVLVAVSSCATALALKEALEHGIRGRYALPVAVLAALVVTQVLAHGMTSPLREMTAAARKMAGGRYDTRVRASSRDEVGELARAFNRMASDLAEADRQRREFVANVSHELRTPISALHAQLENIADGVTAATPGTLRPALDQTERLGRLVGQLLDLSRAEEARDALDRTEFAVAPFLCGVAAESPAAARVVIDAPAGLVVLADRDRLHQVVANLVDNAAAHGPAEGTVTVTARPRGRSGGLALEVADEGPGIAPADRARVFERFHRGGRARDGGTGLGLAIARWAVELHGGHIEVADEGPGCRIRVLIPG